jgi:hypothetical protein
MVGVFRVRASQGGGALADWTSFERRQRSEVVRALVPRSAKDLRVRGTGLVMAAGAEVGHALIVRARGPVAGIDVRVWTGAVGPPAPTVTQLADTELTNA